MNTDKAISQAAAALGRKGGKSTSESKRVAARENGKRGGRPKMHIVTIRYPRNAETMTGWRKFERRFSNTENALSWARDRDHQIDEERGNRWPRQYLVDGRDVEFIEYVGAW